MTSKLVLTPDKDYSNPRFNYIRAGYSLVFFGLSAFSPFSSVLFESKGFSPSENGLLNAVNPLCVLFVIPPVAYIAETNKLQSHFMYFSAIVSSILLSIVFVSDDKFIVTVLTCAFYVVNAPLLPLYDEHTMSVLGEENKKFYGTFRVYGAYSWLVGSLAASLIFGHFGWKWLSLYCLVGFLGIAFSVYKTPVEKEISEHHYVDVWKHILKHPKIMNFLFGLTAMGFGYAIVGTFLNLYLVGEELQAPPVLLGLCTVFTVLFEIPLFQNAERLHRNFTDEQLFMGAVFGYVFRVWAYSVLPNCWLVLLVEPAHAATFGLMWLSGISFLRKSFPKELSNSATGLVHSAAFGLGPVIGLPIGGYLFEQVGPRHLFQIAGFILLSCGAIFWIVHKNCSDDDKQESDEVEAVVA